MHAYLYFTRVNWQLAQTLDIHDGVSRISEKFYMKIRTRARIPFQIISACAGSKACYISETTRYICTRNNEHHLSDKASHVDKYLQSSKACHNSCSVES